MRCSNLFRSLAPAWIVLLALLACGCQKTIRGPGLASVAYTKRQVFVLAAPEAGARIVASLGAGVPVTVLESKNTFSRVNFDEGRIVGWVRGEELSPSRVKEAPAARPAKSPTRRPQPAATAPTVGGGAGQPQATPAEEAATVAPPVAAPVAAPPSAPAASSPPPPAESDGGGIFSPGEAQAAPPPAAPAKGKQARPEAFDPF